VKSKLESSVRIFALGLCTLALVRVLASAATPSPNQALGTFVYPKNNQSEAQQSKDEQACYASAESKTGYYPYGHPQPVAEQQRQGGAVRGAAGGAAYGAAVGGITGGNAGNGAAVGALTGAIVGKRRQNAANAQAEQQAQAQAQALHAQHMDTLRRAYGACLDAKGYSVK
jgi:hypothetical protein